MKTRTFPVYSDPGHAWVKVAKAFLASQFGPHWRKHFTSFSYERGDYVYLEEDCDASTFNKLLRSNGVTPVYKEGSTCGQRYSRIRNYQPLAPL
jgi:hypothetical protein